MKNKKLLSLALSGSIMLGVIGSAVSVYSDTDGGFNNPLSTIQKRGYSSEKFTAKPLVILIDFPDYKYTELDTREDWRINAFSGAETTAEFYEELFFGDDTYKTSDGGEHITVNKFFKEESGGAYELEGKVMGWYTADNNAAEYGSNKDGSDQPRARNLVKEAIEKASKDLELSEFDIEDKWDLDGDKNYNEPDGIIDSLVVLHPGLGEEWGGGSLGEDAIWPFRWGFNVFGEDMTKLSVEQRAKLVDKNPEVIDKSGKKFKMEDFTIFEQDLPVDLFNHEFGHVLGLPDLYGTDGTSKPPVENWSIMGGSYTGNPRGSQPVSYGAWGKEFLQQDSKERGRTANWQNSKILDLQNIDEKGIDIVLDQATLKGKNNDAIKIKLPQATGEKIVTPSEGEICYFSSKGDYLENYMTSKESIDLANTISPKLTFKTWYSIDPGFDFASMQVKEVGTSEWKTIQDETGLTTDKVDPWIVENDPDSIKQRNPGWGITNTSGGQWLDASFNLSGFADKKIDIRFRFKSDSNTSEEGIYFDEIKIVDSDKKIFVDNAEGATKFNLDGFKQSNGIEVYDHYYMLEWRNSGAGTLVDQGLKNINIGRPGLEYDPGLIIWYINQKYNGFKPDQNASNHPGEVCVGIVDADQNPIKYEYKNGKSGIDKMNYQMHDAAFSLRTGSKLEINGGSGEDAYTVKDNSQFMNPIFSDGNDYTGNYSGVPSGLTLKNYGLKVFVTDESRDRSTAKVHIASGNDGSKYTMQQNDLIKAIKSENDKIYITPNTQYGDNAYVEYVGKDNEKQQVVLNYEDGKYVGDAKFLVGGNDWKISHVIFTDKFGNSKAIYNKEVQKIFGVDFSDIGDGTVDPKPEDPTKPNPEEPAKPNPEEPNIDETINQDKEEGNKDKLPQAGAMIGSGFMILGGVTLSGVGVVGLRKRRKNK
ncbi:MAG: immune inhibitor A [Clostridium sp.]|uniref:immune inhibitor A domain-containing protein n=1 Tax=Clostridium sp. TaxID=1506 RepID=UPI0030576447